MLTASDCGLDPQQVRTYVVRPALQRLGAWTQAAENLVLGTAVHESRLRYIDQLDRAGKPGPAFGLWQMEAPTHDDIWRNFLSFRANLAINVNYMLPAGPRNAADMQWNLLYAAAMCRVSYLRSPDDLPAEADAAGMAQLWKHRYNTPLGAGTVEQALPAFALACAP